MRLIALPFAVALGLPAGCAHADAPVPPAASATEAPAGEPAADGVWQKIDPRLRSALGDKSAVRHHAIARLRAPLPAGARAELEARGLRFLSLRADFAHVEGDAEALLRLAARDEVTRLGASGAMEKSAP